MSRSAGILSLLVLMPVVLVAGAARPRSATGNREAVCHRAGPTHRFTLMVDGHALQYHLGHGDTPGACGATDPTPT